MKNERFCESCGKILVFTHEEGKQIGRCSCGFVKEIIVDLAVGHKIKKEKEVGTEIPLQDSHKVENGFPHDCPKCGYGEAEVFDLGAQWSDESNVYLWKCKKCGYVDRQADGTSNN